MYNNLFSKYLRLLFGEPTRSIQIAFKKNIKSVSLFCTHFDTTTLCKTTVPSFWSSRPAQSSGVRVYALCTRCILINNVQILTLYVSCVNWGRGERSSHSMAANDVVFVRVYNIRGDSRRRLNTRHVYNLFSSDRDINLSSGTRAHVHNNITIITTTHVWYTCVCTRARMCACVYTWNEKGHERPSVFVVSSSSVGGEMFIKKKKYLYYYYK